MCNDRTPEDVKELRQILSVIPEPELDYYIRIAINKMQIKKSKRLYAEKLIREFISEIKK